MTVCTFVPPVGAQEAKPRLTTLYPFAAGSNGGGPDAGVALGSGGVLYGTTFNGGTDACYSGCGTVFSLTPPGSPGGAWTESVLYSFEGYSDGDGTNPLAGVVIGGGGVLYGTTQYEYGGNTSAPCGSAGCGTVFSLTPPASPGSWSETVLHTFTGSGGDGANPSAGVVIDKRGVLYGTTEFGGTSNAGTVFSLTPPASPGGRWTEEVLVTFAGGNGANPLAGVVIGKGGVLYGTTNNGGTSGYGTVFSLTPPASQGPWAETVLHEFAGGSVGDGANPGAGVVIGSDGVLYATTRSGGTSGYGTVFSLTPPASQGSAWTETTLYSFAGSPSDGATPLAGVVIGSGGVLYGTTVNGGTVHPYCGIPGCGVAFQLIPPSTPGGVWTESVLHDFTSGSDGEYPHGVMIDKGGVLYGTTDGDGGASSWGTVFRLKP